jgi:type II secretory pathway component GspD/PulD (secretin)
MARHPASATTWLLLVVALATLALGLASPAPALADTTTRTFTLQERPASDVATQVRALYPDARVTPHGQSLIVRASRRELEEIATLVRSIDVAPAQLRITLRTRDLIGGGQSGAGLSGGNGQVAAQAERKVISTRSGQQRSLVVQDGQTAHISSGQIRTLPVAVRAGRNPAAVLAQVKTRSGFLVTPQVISDQAVELSIVSFEEDPASLEGYETEALVTLRRVQPGQWITLGGVATSEERQNQGLVYQVNSSRSRNRQVEVKVELLP